MLHWGRADFYASNVWEISNAYEGWAIFNGVKKRNKSVLDESDVADLRRMMEEGG